MNNQVKRFEHVFTVTEFSRSDSQCKVKTDLYTMHDKTRGKTLNMHFIMHNYDCSQLCAPKKYIYNNNETPFGSVDLTVVVLKQKIL